MMNILNISLVYEILFNMKIKGESEIFKLALKDLIFFKIKFYNNSEHPYQENT